MSTEKKLRDYARAVVSAARLRDDAVLPSDFPDLTDPQFERLCDIVAAYPVPELPVPDHAGYWWPKAVTLRNVSRTPRGEIRIKSGNFQQFQMYLSPEKALDLAAILTAAATEES